MKKSKELERKLKIENLEKGCLNCQAFVSCRMCRKESIIDCDHFVELPEDQQVVVVNLLEWAKRK